MNKNILPIMGISPRNSYYSNPGNIACALKVALREYGKVYVLISDGPDVYNYRAYGYRRLRAEEKARSVGAALKKSVHEVCARDGYSCANRGLSTAQVRIIDWAAEVERAPDYQKKVAELKNLYRTDPLFRQDMRNTTEATLRSRMDKNGDTKKYIERTGMTLAIDRGVHYILAEMAFLEAAPTLLGGEGVEYIYHRPWPVYQNLIAGRYACQRPGNLSFRALASEDCAAH